MNCNNVARQVEEKCCSYYRTLSQLIFDLIKKVTSTGALADDGQSLLVTLLRLLPEELQFTFKFHWECPIGNGKDSKNIEELGE